MTQSALGLRVMVSSATISRIENEILLPDDRLVVQIANALGENPPDLLSAFEQDRRTRTGISVFPIYDTLELVHDYLESLEQLRIAGKPQEIVGKINNLIGNRLRPLLSQVSGVDERILRRVFVKALVIRVMAYTAFVGANQTGQNLKDLTREISANIEYFSEEDRRYRDLALILPAMVAYLCHDYTSAAHDYDWLLEHRLVEDANVLGIAYRDRIVIAARLSDMKSYQLWAERANRAVVEHQLSLSRVAEIYEGQARGALYLSQKNVSELIDEAERAYSVAHASGSAWPFVRAQLARTRAEYSMWNTQLCEDDILKVVSEAAGLFKAGGYTRYQLQLGTMLLTASKASGRLREFYHSLDKPQVTDGQYG